MGFNVITILTFGKNKDCDNIPTPPVAPECPDKHKNTKGVGHTTHGQGEGLGHHKDCVDPVDPPTIDPPGGDVDEEFGPNCPEENSINTLTSQLTPMLTVNEDVIDGCIEGSTPPTDATPPPSDVDGEVGVNEEPVINELTEQPIITVQTTPQQRTVVTGIQPRTETTNVVAATLPQTNGAQQYYALVGVLLIVISSLILFVRRRYDI